jgi:hypothetical protein
MMGEVPARRLCAWCGRLARVDRMINGLGSRCARDLGVTGRKLDTVQDGPDLLDLLDLLAGDTGDSPA